MTRSSREPRRMWVAPGRRAARRSRLRVACNCFTIYSETHYKTKRKQNVRRFLEWRVSACVSRVAALGFCTFMHHGVLSRTQTKNVRLSFLRQEVARGIVRTSGPLRWRAHAADGVRNPKRRGGDEWRGRPPVAGLLQHLHASKLGGR